MRFLLETYPEGIERIQGKELFKEWCAWCSEERHETGSNTRFGGLIKKVRVGVGDEAQGVTHRLLKGRITYALTPMKVFPLAAYFGVVAVDHHQNQDPHQSNEPGEQALEEKGDRGDSSSFKLNRLENIYIKGINPPTSTKETLCTSEPAPLSPQHPADAFTDSSWALSSESFIEAEAPLPVYFSGINGALLIGKIPGPDRSKDLMLVRTPSDNIIGCTRDDYTHEDQP